MAPQANTVGFPLSPPEVAATGGGFSGALKTVRGLFLGAKYEAAIADIEKAFDVSRRTAERIYAGQQVSADTALKLVFHETSGPVFAQEALLRLPPERRVIVAQALMKAFELAWLQARQEELLNIPQAVFPAKKTNRDGGQDVR